jgi:hypothetical protein
MTSTNGINYTYNGLTLVNGEVKFRKTGDWGTSWGSSSWPAGVASSGGPNIPTTAGTYNVSFNRVTGAFAFQDPNAGIVTINGTANNTGAAIQMVTTDNTNYSLIDQQLVSGNIATNRSVCGTSQYQWEFSQVTPLTGLPSVVNGSMGGSRVLNLNVVDGIANGQTYNVRIRSKHADATTTVFSSNSCVRTVGAAGMPTIESEGVLAERSFNGITASIYPNPNNGNTVVLNVNGMEGVLQVKVTDATGKLIQRSQYAVEGSLNTNLNFDHTLSSGLYLVELTNGQQSQTLRMVVNR